MVLKINTVHYTVLSFSNDLVGEKNMYKRQKSNSSFVDVVSRSDHESNLCFHCRGTCSGSTGS